MTLNDIGNTSAEGLLCLTNNTQCCSTDPTPSESAASKEWYTPDGHPVGDNNTGFHRNRGAGVVRLLYYNEPSPTGLFRCEVPDASGDKQSIYVGVYTEEDGMNCY